MKTILGAAIVALSLGMNVAAQADSIVPKDAQSAIMADLQKHFGVCAGSNGEEFWVGAVVAGAENRFAPVLGAQPQGTVLAYYQFAGFNGGPRVYENRETVSSIDNRNGILDRYTVTFKISAYRVYERGQWSQWQSGNRSGPETTLVIYTATQTNRGWVVNSQFLMAQAPVQPASCPAGL